MRVLRDIGNRRLNRGLPISGCPEAVIGEWQQRSIAGRYSNKRVCMSHRFTLFPSTTTVKRFIHRFGGIGGTHYSIRRRGDVLFQVYHDDPYAETGQFYEFDDEQWGGLFDSAEAAERELIRLLPGLEEIPIERV